MTIKLGRRGDTIVEVLLAIAISSFALTAGYASVDNSLTTEREAQDRSEATQMVQSQAESINDIYNTKADQALLVHAINSGDTFCINDPTIEYAVANGCNFSQLSIAPPDNPTGYIHARTSPSPYYTITVSNSSTTVSNPPPGWTLYQVTINAKWTNAGGGGEDNLTVVYRLN